MKKIIFLIFLVTALPIFLFSQPFKIKNGASLSPSGEFFALVVFVEIDYDEGPCLCGLNSSNDYPSTWPVVNGITQVPTDAHTYFNPSLSSYQNNPAFITDLYYQSSFGSYKLFGDYYPKVLKVNCNEVGHGNGLGLIVAKLNEEYQNGPLFTANNLPLSAFDTWTPTNRLQKINSSDGKIDLLYIIWRNNKFLNGCNGTDYSGFGVSLVSTTTPVAGLSGVNTVTSFNASNSAPGGYNITLMEHMHGTFGGNHWHSGGGAGVHTFVAVPMNYGLTAQSGRTMNAPSAWDRWMMEYQNPNKNFLISAQDISTGVEIDTENFSIDNFPNGYTFRLRDFISTGDAIRIKLPHINWQQNGDVKNQYIWLENHRMNSRFNKYTEAECADYGSHRYGTPGVYAYYQVGKDIKESSSSSILYNASPHSMPNALGSFILPITAEGNFDFKYRFDLIQPKLDICSNWNNVNIPVDKSQSLANPFTGFSDLFQTLDTDNDGFLYSEGDTIMYGLQ